MATVSGRDRLEPAEQAEVRALAVSAEATYGAPPLNDQAFSRLSDAEPGLIHLLAEENGELIGYAQLDHVEVTVVGRPDAIDILLAAGEAAAHSDQLLLWSHGRRSAVGAVAEARGYEVIRTLWQLRRPLTAVQEVAPPPGVTIRTFVPGQDEAAWLRVNAAAFATHPEQGRWTWRDLAAREAEPWFDPFRLLPRRTGCCRRRLPLDEAALGRCRRGVRAGRRSGGAGRAPGAGSSFGRPPVPRRARLA